mgnify:CR=1 FL=1
MVKVEEGKEEHVRAQFNKCSVPFVPFLGSADIPQLDDAASRGASALSLLSFICRAECGRAANRAQRGSAHPVSGSAPRVRQISSSRDFYLILPDTIPPFAASTRIAFHFRVPRERVSRLSLPRFSDSERKRDYVAQFRVISRSFVASARGLTFSRSRRNSRGATEMRHEATKNIYRPQFAWKSNVARRHGRETKDSRFFLFLFLFAIAAGRGTSSKIKLYKKEIGGERRRGGTIEWTRRAQCRLAKPIGIFQAKQETASSVR